MRGQCRALTVDADEVFGGTFLEPGLFFSLPKAMLTFGDERMTIEDCLPGAPRDHAEKALRNQEV